MPRDIPLGNGSLQVAFDESYQIRDLFFPHVGGENHAQGYPSRFGIWVDGELSWLGSGWEISLDYQDDTLVSQVRAVHHRLGIELECQGAVDFHENLYLRRVQVRNLADRPRRTLLFFHHDFNVGQSDMGNTALFDPQLEAIIHYRGPRYFLVNVLSGGRAGITEYATGVKRANGREGTWRDAEDGRLERNPMAQGATDSTIGVPLDLEPLGRRELHYWLAAGATHREVRILNQMVVERHPQSFIDRTAAYWRLWVRAGALELGDLPPAVARLYRRSLLILRTHIDNDGAIIAATDSDIVSYSRDTYCYLWPRDGALVAHALDRAGYSEITKTFYRFCLRIVREEGYFLHKYTPEGALGSSWHPWVKDGVPQLPIQEDGTALVLWALWEHFHRYRDVEFVKPLYRPLITLAGDFMETYRDRETGLPLPSWDLWEERHGVLTFTAATVWAGLRAAGGFARAFGEESRAARYEQACREIQQGMDRHLYCPDSSRFARMLETAAGRPTVDMTVDASLYGLFAFGPYDSRDPRVAGTMQAIESDLWVRSAAGGVARYQGDSYQRVAGDEGPGNPWLICTVWLAQYYVARAERREDLEAALRILEWVTGLALPSGVLAEQVHPDTLRPLSVAPLTWSHAAYVTAVQEYLDKLRALNRCSECGAPQPESPLKELAADADSSIRRVTHEAD